MESSLVDEMLERNKDFAAYHRPYKFFSESIGRKKPSILIITCLDSRCKPEEFLCLMPGEAVVFRVGGGRVAPLVAQIASMDCFIGGFKDLMIIHHTDCGATYLTEEKIHSHILKEEGVSVEDAKTLVLPVIGNLEQSVHDDVKLLKGTKVIRRELRERTKGYLYDVKTGIIRRVESTI
ncbi:carbonic anhydrase [Trichoderma sp. SZMC 28014]